MGGRSEGDAGEEADHGGVRCGDGAGGDHGGGGVQVSNFFSISFSCFFYYQNPFSFSKP